MSAKDITLEDLGYESYEDDGFTCYEKKTHKSIEPTYIYFNRLAREVFLDRKKKGLILDSQLLQAIYNKCKELRWLDV